MGEEETQRWGIHQVVAGDITTRLIRLAAERHGRPDAIFHGAGGASVADSWARPELDYARTVASTEELIDAAVGFSDMPMIIYPSSAAVYGGFQTGPIKEDCQPQPISPYGANKLLAEGLLHSAHRVHGIRCGIIRYFSLYGEGLRKQLLWDISRRVLGGESQLTLSGTGEELRDFLYVGDAVSLVAHVLNHIGDGFVTVNGASGIATSVGDLARALLSALEIDTEIDFTGEIRKGDPASLVADTTKLDEIGFTPKYNLEAGLKNYARWVRAELSPATGGRVELA